MPILPIPLQSGTTTPATNERLINLYAELAPKSGRGNVVLKSWPGMVSVGSLGPVYGLANHRGTLYAATASGLFSVSSGGALTAQTHSGSISADGTVILYNGIDFYCSAIGQAAYIDGYFLRTEPAYAGRFAWTSPYTATWAPLDFATAEGSPDALVGIAVAHREIWLFGERSTEIWYNAGDLDRTFQRITGAFIERGARGGIAVVGPTPYWVGDDGIVYRAAGYVPERVSTSAVEAIVAAQTDSPVGFGLTWDGHELYVLRYHDACLVYDTGSGLWHERQSWQSDTWAATCSAEVDGTVYVGGAGGLYRLDGETYTDAGTNLRRQFVTPPIFSADAYQRMSYVEILADMGRGLSSGQGSDPQASLRWSDDGGRTWSNEHWQSLGAIGEYSKRARWWRLGRYRERCFEVTITDPVPYQVLGMVSAVG